LQKFSYTSDDFLYIKGLIYRIAGISLAPFKRDLVYICLARRLRARQLDSFIAYIQLLESCDVLENEELVNALTTNMTSFFREPHHFPILSKHVETKTTSHPINIWTCASSTRWPRMNRVVWCSACRRRRLHGGAMRLRRCMTYPDGCLLGCRPRENAASGFNPGGLPVR